MFLLIRGQLPIRGHANQALLDSAAALPLLSLSRLPVRALPCSRFVFFLQGAPTLRPRGSREEPEEARKQMGQTGRREFRPNTEKDRRPSVSRRHSVLLHISSAVSPPCPPPSSQLNIFSSSDSPSVSPGADPIGNAARIHVDHSPARVRSARGTALPCPPATHTRWRRAEKEWETSANSRSPRESGT